MAGTRFSIDARVLEPLAARIRVAADLDTRTLMPRLGEYLQRSTQDRFKPQTEPDGGAWPALQPHTLARKKRNRDKLLTERGHLRRSIFYRLPAPGVVEVASPMAHAATHQFGVGGIFAVRGRSVVLSPGAPVAAAATRPAWPVPKSSAARARSGESAPR
jgi:phage gpG-like protein